MDLHSVLRRAYIHYPQTAVDIYTVHYPNYIHGNLWAMFLIVQFAVDLNDTVVTASVNPHSLRLCDISVLDHYPACLHWARSTKTSLHH